MKGQPPVIDGLFHKRVIVDDSFWTLEDGDLVLNLQKDNKMEWWKCVIQGIYAATYFDIEVDASYLVRL